MNENKATERRKRYIIGNWKMNLNLEEARALINGIDIELESEDDSQGIICISPPYPFLYLLENKKNINMCSQNCSSIDAGALTGEVSASMLSSMGVQYTIVGHSERRSMFNESPEEIKDKLDILLKNNITPVFCCGEPEDIRDQQSHLEYVSDQIKSSLFHLSDSQISKVIVAYEPMWAIGTGKTATPLEIEEMHTSIRQNFSLKFGEVTANRISILYGGSVKPENSRDILSINNVDGALVGGASLKINSFIEISRMI